ncbi:MAG TPA: iron ABC transporter permease [Thermosulfurimonas dismutans]|uniref:Iron ABC transporter permease n=1 Tax=Thermosulfurimonas dismutans TaxID=999894 RepID=A0A7C3GS80_9BACT|nr:iron ABC transporter permease [Thermosulfurimonas dismutans]
MPSKVGVWIIVLGGGLILYLSLCVGPAGFEPFLPLRILEGRLQGTKAGVSPALVDIIWEIRLPRVILAGMVGAALASSGAALQAIFRNPLVDPYLLGLSAGGALGCAVAVAWFPRIPIPLAAFLFSYLAAVLTYGVARLSGEVSRLSLILSGVIVSAGLMALVSLIKFLVDPHRMAEIVTWMMGSFALSNWEAVRRTLGPIVIGLLGLYVLRFRLNLLSLSEDEARSLGVAVEEERALIMALAALTVGAGVAAAGIVGWVGLMVPHLVRLWAGPDHRRLIPLSMWTGAVLLVISDSLARTLTSFDLPVGIITSLVGIPFFVYLLHRERLGGTGYA